MRLIDTYPEGPERKTLSCYFAGVNVSGVARQSLGAPRGETIRTFYI